jgi:hypothetical protein
MPAPIPPLIEAAFILLAVSPLLAFRAWMFQDMINNERLPISDKNTWTLMFLLLNVFGAAIYYVNVYRNRR